jgi:hypothetical protein
MHKIQPCDWMALFCENAAFAEEDNAYKLFSCLTLPMTFYDKRDCPRAGQYFRAGKIICWNILGKNNCIRAKYPQILFQSDLDTYAGGMLMTAKAKKIELCDFVILFFVRNAWPILIDIK